jgi:hypothetical protein
MPDYSIRSPKRSHLMVDLAAEVASANWKGVKA